MIINNKKFLRIFFRVVLYGFAIIGFIFTGVFFAMKLHLTDVKGSIDSRNSFFKQNKNQEKIKKLDKALWMNSIEWQTLKDGLIKDKDLINKVSKEVDISPRFLVSSVISEQLRFFTSNRESFKKYFEPLKILGTYTQFSYGISGIKMETAEKIENNLKDKESPFYIGKKYEHILDYNNVYNIDEARLARFTDSHDHYYSYLYTALYIKQIIRQWENEGYSIKSRPEVIATLFNLGFDKSFPKENPDVGGSVINIDGVDYTFGGLAYDFYYSDELSDIFSLR